MRVLCYPADASRCGRRIIWPAEALIAQGADIVIGDRHKPDDPIWHEGADVVVLQRPMLRRYVEPHLDDNGVPEPAVIDLLKADGMKVVVDIDDDFTALNRKNAVWERTHPSVSPDCNWQHLSTACKMADLVTVTTPALARRYGGHGRVAVIPNHIPESYLKIERPTRRVPILGNFGRIVGYREDDRRVVGWSGAVATHPDDLQVTRGGVCKALQQTGASFYMVGPPDGVQANLGLSEPVVASGWIDLDRYPYEMAKIDVGIVPLEDTAFNRAKSWLKMMELAALGVVPVGSPTLPNLEFANRYRLPIAYKPRDWERWVRRLVVDDALRIEMSQAGREAMREETIEANAYRWWDVWESAYARNERRTA